MAITTYNEVRSAFLSRSAGDLNERHQRARSYIDEANLFRGWKRAEEVPVSLDPLPFVLEHGEITDLQRDLTAWAESLAATYRDLWDAQTLVDAGVLPSSTLWGEARFDPGFARCLPSASPPLYVLGFTLERSPSGWRVTRVDSERPYGLGYALEDRIVHGRCFFSVLHPDNLLRLAPFFSRMKAMWSAAAPQVRETPAVMVWTDGPDDPNYFEPVYLARYFGYPLVESRDLTVRSGRLYLKTLAGLQPVDVLMRWVSDTSIDPLVGNPPPAGGVAGVVQAVRDGLVTVGNAPGSGLLSLPAVTSRIPACAEHLTGKSLPLSTLPGENTLAEPFWDGDGWVERSAVLRLFLARVDTGWELMPGGIVEARGDDTIFRKDVWVLEPTAVPQVSLLPDGERPTSIVRAGELPSRVADDLFWLGRYVERAWFDARVLETWWDVAFEARLESHLSLDSHLGRLLREIGATVSDDETGDAADTLPTGEMDASTEDIPIAPSDRWRLTRSLAEIRRISAHVLDRLSAETHRILSSFSAHPVPTDTAEIVDFFEDLNLRLAALNGLTNENMTRSAAWRFLDMGRRIERAELALVAIRALFVQDVSETPLTILLDLFDSSLTYRSRYRLSPQPAPVLDLLVLDETNPRSVAFQVEQLARHIEALPRAAGRAYRSVEERLILELSTTIRLADAQEYAPDGALQLCDRIDHLLSSVTETIYHRYLAKVDVTAALQARLGVTFP
jgi:uncharacterized circularly permuted ATP-grasp superfamily protein/uncharacterized alpha-E superfamily protein